MATQHEAKPEAERPGFAAIETAMRDLGHQYGAGMHVTDGVHSAKVRAFKGLLAARAAGIVHENQAAHFAALWASATGAPLTDKSRASATSKVKVWLAAGNSNSLAPFSRDTLKLADELAGKEREYGNRYFEKLTTLLRAVRKHERVLREDEIVAVLSGSKPDEAADALADLVAALKRVVTGYEAAKEAFPADETIAKLLNDAILRHETAAAMLAKRNADAKAASYSAEQTPKKPTATAENNSTEQYSDDAGDLAASLGLLISFQQAA